MERDNAYCKECKNFVAVDAKSDLFACSHCGAMLHVREAMETYQKALQKPYPQEDIQAVEIRFCGGNGDLKEGSLQGEEYRK